MSNTDSVKIPVTSTFNGFDETSEIPDITGRVSFPEEEQKILAFWKEIDAFQTSLKLSEGRPIFSFYDGPPFATGLPHYGHILAGTIKDVVTRYAHSTGHYVERRFGWDTHGLPVEHAIDKKLNITGPQDVAKIGIGAYNEECRSIVMTYSKEWEQTITRLGRWIDFRNDYKSLDPTFMETIWWVFKQLFEKNQVYRGFRIMPYSTATYTPLSNFEANLNYKDVVDPSVVISFPLIDEPDVSILAWTTTPWTLPSNFALCVNPEFEYVKILDEETGSKWILLESRLSMVYKDVKKAKYKVLEKIKGVDLKGKKYKPLFNFFPELEDKAWVILSDSYVGNDSGTGIVHQAPAFGEDDFRVCVAAGLFNGEDDLPETVDESGHLKEVIATYSGMYFKDADKPIQKDLKQSGRLIRQSQITHSYPFCWRSDTPLMYKAVPAWFVRVSNINDQLVNNNNGTYWVPDFVKERRFHNWLENAKDWNISRNRYWGTPIPLWVSDDFEEIVAIGSVEELRKLSGCDEIKDLHRHNIDHITIPSQKGKGELKRISEVFDCWFESGSMPYAQQHYPFENVEKFQRSFPADFIAEGIDQTRGWFYTLMVLGTHLFGKAPFKNVIVNGLILASDGKKMSKRLQNYPDPVKVIDEYGADVLRLYLINSPAVRAENLRFREEGVKELVARVFLPWYNAYRFFFAQLQLFKSEQNIDFKYNPHLNLKAGNVMDRWIMASTQTLIKEVGEEMKAYRLYNVLPKLLNMIDDLTNWYIRFNRKRLKGENGPEDTIAALNTLFDVLFTLTKLMSPFTPFIVESMYQNLLYCLPKPKADEVSVHFLPFPEIKSKYFDSDIERAVKSMQQVIELGRYIRDQRTVPLKTPLRKIVIISPDEQLHKDIKELENYILEELNIREIVITSKEKEYGVGYKLIPDWKVLGTKLKKDVQKVRKAMDTIPQEDIVNFIKTGKITIVGFELTNEDFTVSRTFDDEKDKNLAAQWTNEVLVILDVELDDNLMKEGIAREILNRIQRARKKADLVALDVVEYQYKIVSDEEKEIENVLRSQSDLLQKSLKQDITQYNDTKGTIVFEEEQQVGNATFLLRLVKPE